MPRFDLAAFDLDGTLVGAAGVVRPRVRAAVERMLRAGVTGCIVTGRMYRSALPFARTLDLSAPLVCYQGAAVFDVQRDVVLRDVPLPIATVREIVAVAASSGVHLQLYRNDEYYCERRNRFSELYANISGVEPVIVPSLAEAFADSPATKAVFIADPPDAERFARPLRATLGARAYVTRSYPQFVEATHPSVDKGDALRFVAERLGVSLDRVVAVGDAWNDAPLLESAGMGIAMGTAPSELRGLAAAVVAGVEDDGAAQAIEEYILA